MRITTESQLISFLKTNKINISDFDYKENAKNDKQFIMRGRRFYENPWMWKLVFENKKLKPAKDFFIDSYYRFADDNVFAAIFKTDLKHEDIDELIDLLKDSYYYKNDILKEELNLDSILVSAVIDDSSLFKAILDFAKDVNYKPKYGNFGNIGNGEGFLEDCRIGNNDIFKILLEEGLDISQRDDLGFILAVKHSNYTFALKLLDYGASIDSKNGLAYKMFLRNNSKRYCKSGEEYSHNVLMKKFKENIKKKE